jgi:lipopolysaccharide export system protein LptA
LISALLIASSQEPVRHKDPQETKPINWRAYDTETGELFLEFNGYGQLDQNRGTASLTRIEVRYDTKATQEQPAHTIHVYANRCAAEGLRSSEDGGQKFVLKFTEGLWVMMDDDVRLWTSEGTLESHSKVLKCPGTTHLVHFQWPASLDLASALVFMDPKEMAWLRAFGAPEPDLELVGDDFVFDAASSTFTASRNGRIRVKGDPGHAINGDRKKKPRRGGDDPTELRCEGPLRLRRLGFPNAEEWPTLHVTAEKNVVIERRDKNSLTRARSDTASFYIATPPKKVEAEPRPLSAVLAGGVRIEVDGTFSATGELVEWNHQDGLMRMTGDPRVEVVQGNQKLLSREVLVDKSNRTIDFKGDIEASFLSSEGAKDLMTLVPGSLRVLTDARGRPVAVRARNGVRLTSGGSGADALRAEGTAFEWDLITGEGMLRGTPFARIHQGFNMVIAPLVSFQGDTFESSLMTVKGPKVMRFFNELSPPRNPGRDLVDAALGLPGLAPRPSEPSLHTSASLLEAAIGLPGLQKIPDRRNAVTDFTITCDGDVQVDQKAGIVKLVDRCRVQAQDSTLNADRLFVFLKETSRTPGRKTAIDRVVGSGHIVAVYTKGPQNGPLRVEGETFELKLDPAPDSKGRGIVSIAGHPSGRLRFSGRDSRFQRMWINLDTNPPTIWMSKGALPLIF